MINRETLLNAMATGSGGLFPYTCTYASGTTFTISASGVDWTPVFLKGLKIEMTNGGEKRYGYVVSSSYSNPTTTVTVTGLNDASGNIESIANSAITDVYIGSSDVLRSHPIYIKYTPTLTGFSVNPTTINNYFFVQGRVCFVSGFNSGGTSNATTFTATLPITASAFGNSVYSWARVQDNGTFATTPGMARIDTAGSVINLFKDQNGAAFTASGTKSGFWEIFYYI